MVAEVVVGAGGIVVAPLAGGVTGQMAVQIVVGGVIPSTPVPLIMVTTQAPMEVEEGMVVGVEVMEAGMVIINSYPILPRRHTRLILCHLLRNMGVTGGILIVDPHKTMAGMDQQRFPLRETHLPITVVMGSEGVAA